jgi:hypothetical protein
LINNAKNKVNIIALQHIIKKRRDIMEFSDAAIKKNDINHYSSNEECYYDDCEECMEFKKAKDIFDDIYNRESEK